MSINPWQLLKATLPGFIDIEGKLSTYVKIGMQARGRKLVGLPGRQKRVSSPLDETAAVALGGVACRYLREA